MRLGFLASRCNMYYYSTTDKGPHLIPDSLKQLLREKMTPPGAVICQLKWFSFRYGICHGTCLVAQVFVELMECTLLQ